MLALSAYFENDQIYSIVIKMRLASLRKRNKMHADREISHHKKTHFHKKRNYIGDDYLNKIVPPRRTWISPGNKRRHIELTNTQSRIKFSLLGTYVKTKRLSCNGSIEPPPWYKEFLFFCDYIRLKIKLIDSEGFESPEILAIPKKMNNDGQMEYRPLAKYNIENRIIIGLTAKYLVQALDNEFYSNSFAFRRNMPGGKAITHHTAFNKIVEYNVKTG